MSLPTTDVEDEEFYRYYRFSGLHHSEPQIQGIYPKAGMVGLYSPGYLKNQHPTAYMFPLGGYIVYASFLPTPLEQIAFQRDPLGITGGYVVRGLGASIHDLVRTVGDPIGVAQSGIQRESRGLAKLKPDPIQAISAWNYAAEQARVDRRHLFSENYEPVIWT